MSLPTVDRKGHNADIDHDNVKGEPTSFDESIENNVNAAVMNPLSGKSQQQLLSEVEEFCNTHGFQSDLAIFQKGALVAQHPNSFEDLPQLTEEDRYHLRREITHRWSQVGSSALQTVPKC